MTRKLFTSASFYKISGAIYLLVLGWLLFLPPFRDGTITGYNLVPLNSWAEFAEMFRPTSLHYWIANVPGNILAFYVIPFILFGAFSLRPSVIRAILIAVILPATIEFAQWFFSVGYANIDDVLLNFIGFMSGYWHWTKRRKNKVAGQAFSSQTSTR